MSSDKFFPLGKAITQKPYANDKQDIKRWALQIAISDRLDLIYADCCGEDLEQRLARLEKEYPEDHQLLVDEIALVNDMLQMLYREFGPEEATPWR